MENQEKRQYPMAVKISLGVFLFIGASVAVLALVGKYHTEWLDGGFDAVERALKVDKPVLYELVCDRNITLKKGERFEVLMTNGGETVVMPKNGIEINSESLIKVGSHEQ